MVRLNGSVFMVCLRYVQKLISRPWNAVNNTKKSQISVNFDKLDKNKLPIELANLKMRLFSAKKKAAIEQRKSGTEYSSRTMASNRNQASV